MAKDHGPQIKNDELYEDLRADGASKEKAARIANAQAAARSITKARISRTRSKDELYDEAREIGIEGRSKMDKDDLVEGVREREGERRRHRPSASCRGPLCRSGRHRTSAPRPRGGSRRRPG